MPLDINYHNRDNVMDDTTNSYEYVSSATPKAERCIMARYRLIEGVPFGNKAWDELERAGDTAVNRELLKRYTKDSIQPLINEGLIRAAADYDDVEVIVEYSKAVKAVQAQVIFYDVPAGRDNQVVFIAPWQRVT